MHTRAEVVDGRDTIKRYPIQYPIAAYTFPEKALIQDVRIDEAYIRIELADGRHLAIPLNWVPTVYHATPEDRSRFRINRSRTMIIWDPNEGPINEELSVQDYLITRMPATE